MIGSFPITFAKHQASHHKLRIWKMRKIPCWLQDYGLLFLSSRMPQVLAPAPSSGPKSRNRPIANCYEESVLWKYIKYIILSLLFSLYQRREWKWYMKKHCTQMNRTMENTWNKAFSRCQFYVDISANDPNGCFPLCSLHILRITDA